MTPRLTPLQRELLDAFFARTQALFLTGGGVLVGFDFGHRTTDDLDLFGFPEVDLDEAERVLTDAALAVGATCEPLSRHSDFRRWLAVRGAERCVVDLVRDRAPVVEREKRRLGALVLDTRREIAANKVAALVGRSEPRDLIDLKLLLEAGEPLERALADAMSKDAGVDAATVAWTLDSLRIGPTAHLPGGADPAALDAFREALVLKLRAMAHASTPK
ncbi:MAG: nucleotidyl transferase AbiEii/AbiGii toxin family protein [Myxococcus sp.]|nr:nucleotidyl transferase AbiEii/AbiGii toxin family protein [Myxococcus sp.]